MSYKKTATHLFRKKILVKSLPRKLKIMRLNLKNLFKTVLFKQKHSLLKKSFIPNKNKMKGVFNLLLFKSLYKVLVMPIPRIQLSRIKVLCSNNEFIFTLLSRQLKNMKAVLKKVSMIRSYFKPFTVINRNHKILLKYNIIRYAKWRSIIKRRATISKRSLWIKRTRLRYRLFPMKAYSRKRHKLFKKRFSYMSYKKKAFSNIKTKTQKLMPAMLVLRKYRFLRQVLRKKYKSRLSIIDSLNPVKIFRRSGLLVGNFRRQHKHYNAFIKKYIRVFYKRFTKKFRFKHRRIKRLKAYFSPVTQQFEAHYVSQWSKFCKFVQKKIGWKTKRRFLKKRRLFRILRRVPRLFLKQYVTKPKRQKYFLLKSQRVKHRNFKRKFKKEKISRKNTRVKLFSKFKPKTNNFIKHKNMLNKIMPRVQLRSRWVNSKWKRAINPKLRWVWNRRHFRPIKKNYKWWFSVSNVKNIKKHSSRMISRTKSYFDYENNARKIGKVIRLHRKKFFSVSGKRRYINRQRMLLPHERRTKAITKKKLLVHIISFMLNQSRGKYNSFRVKKPIVSFPKKRTKNYVSFSRRFMTTGNDFKHNIPNTTGNVVGADNLRDHLPMVIKTYSPFLRLFRKILVIFFLWVLFVRSFFIENRTNLFFYFMLPMITLIFFSLMKIYPDTFTAFSETVFLIYMGIQLMTYDHIGSLISSHILTDYNPVISVTTLISLKKHTLFPVRYTVTTSLTAIVLGKTAMTSTGRAAIVGGALTAGVYLYNSYADRQQRDQHFYAARTEAREEAERVRQHERDRWAHERDKWAHERAKKKSWWSRE